MVRQLKYREAISEAFLQGMQADPNVFVFGLGVDDHKGIFGTTKDIHEVFGSQRVFDVPACEGALTGVAIGAALNGKRPVLVHARNDFMLLALDQMLNNAAKWNYVYANETQVPIVVRGIIGKGWGQGATHSQSLQSVIAHFPGIIVAMPSNAYDAKGIILESLHSSSPVVLLEHRALYERSCAVPQEPYRIKFGQASRVREGKDCTIVATSLMVQEALIAADSLAQLGIELDIIDPVTVQPLDVQSILNSVERTGYCVVADTSWQSCGFASEVSATVAQYGFENLKGPIERITLPACPCPVSTVLEEEFYPTSKDIIKAVVRLLNKDGLKVHVKRMEDTFVGPY